MRTLTVAPRPCLRGHRPLDPDRRLDGVSGRPEDREERVALGADLGAAAGTGVPDELIVPREQAAVVGPSSSTRRVEPSMSVNRKVAVPVGSSVMGSQFRAASP